MHTPRSKDREDCIGKRESGKRGAARTIPRSGCVARRVQNCMKALGIEFCTPQKSAKQCENKGDSGRPVVGTTREWKISGYSHSVVTESVRKPMKPKVLRAELGGWEESLEVEGGTKRNENGPGRRSMGYGSTKCDYCQGTVPCGNDSNVRHGSGADGRTWRENGSLVRQGKAGGRNQEATSRRGELQKRKRGPSTTRQQKRADAPVGMTKWSGRGIRIGMRGEEEGGGIRRLYGPGRFGDRREP